QRLPTSFEGASRGRDLSRFALAPPRGPDFLRERGAPRREDSAAGRRGEAEGHGARPERRVRPRVHRAQDVDRSRGETARDRRPPLARRPEPRSAGDGPAFTAGRDPRPREDVLQSGAGGCQVPGVVVRGHYSLNSIRRRPGRPRGPSHGVATYGKTPRATPGIR